MKVHGIQCIVNSQVKEDAIEKLQAEDSQQLVKLKMLGKRNPSRPAFLILSWIGHA